MPEKVSECCHLSLVAIALGSDSTESNSLVQVGRPQKMSHQ